MVIKKQRISRADRAFARGVRRLNLDDDGRPKPPLDPIPEYEPKKTPGDFFNFEAVIDPAIQLSEDAARRIEKQLRQAVLMEIAQLEFLPEVVVRSTHRSGSRGIEVCLVRQ